ncbi:MAG: glycosyltransferase family A protein [Patescibacteria group bacterium]
MISVIIPTYNRLNRLQNCLRSVLALNYIDYEIIIVNDGSTDGTRDWLDRFNKPKIKSIHHLKNLGPSASRNTGINLASGNILAFTDDDCIVDGNWLIELEKVLRNNPCDFVFGATYYISKHYKGYFPERLTSNGGGTWPGGANIAFKKEVFEKIGGFNSDFDKYHNEDTETAIRAVAKGCEYKRAPNALVFHQPDKWTTQSLLSSAKNLSVWPALKSKFPKHYLVFGGPTKWKIAAEPSDYLKIVFLPILILILFVRYLYRGKRDLKIFFTKWPVWLILRRWYVWKESIKHRVFFA